MSLRMVQGSTSVGQEAGGQNVGKSLYCGFTGRDGQGRVSRPGMG